MRTRHVEVGCWPLFQLWWENRVNAGTGGSSLCASPATSPAAAPAAAPCLSGSRAPAATAGLLAVTGHPGAWANGATSRAIGSWYSVGLPIGIG